MSIALHPDAATRRRLASVAQGREAADLVLAGGSLVNVFTDELLPGWGLAVAAGRVAHVGPDAEVRERAGGATEVVELEGGLIAPGLVEGHTHLTRARVSDFMDLHVAAGVTTCVVESMELGAVAGPEGVRVLLDQAAGLAGRLYFTVSGLITGDPDQEAAIETEAWVALLDHARVAGVGEIYWAGQLRGHARTEAMVTAALERGLAVEGHGAGARTAALSAMAALGVGSDHEATDAGGVLARLRLGLSGMARHGATRQDLAAIAPLWQGSEGAPGRLALVTDGVEPDLLLQGRALNSVVDAATGSGLSLPRAVRMASLAVAEHLGLGRWLGGLGPGMLADVAILPPGAGFRPTRVLVGGRDPAPSRVAEFPPWMLDTVHAQALAPDLLAHPGPGRWRAIEFVAPLVTREVETDGADALVCTVSDRLGGRRGFRGLVRGLGLRGGAVAISSAWESTGVLLVGDRPDDLAVAARRLQELGGGAVVVREGRVLAEWSAPVAGLYSTAPIGQVVSEVTAVNRALTELGAAWPNPLLSLETLTTAAIPFLRIWAGGYTRLRDGAHLGLEWEA